jgi:hypothetical protein
VTQMLKAFSILKQRRCCCRSLPAMFGTVLPPKARCLGGSLAHRRLRRGRVSADHLWARGSLKRCRQFASRAAEGLASTVGVSL